MVQAARRPHPHVLSFRRSPGSGRRVHLGPPDPVLGPHCSRPIQRRAGDQMRTDEARGMSALIGEVLAAGARRAAELHTAIGERVFTNVGRGIPGAVTPVQRLHDGITATAYAQAESLVRVGGRVAGQVTAHFTDGRSGLDRPGLQPWLAVLNAAHGDRLTGDLAPLALPMTLRHDGADLDVEDPHALAPRVPARHRPPGRVPPRARRDRALVALPRRTPPRRPDGDLRDAAAARSRLHPGVDPLQHRAADLGQRPSPRRPPRPALHLLAPARPRHRPHRPLHGRPGSAQRGRPRHRPRHRRPRMDRAGSRHRYARITASGCPARARHEPARAPAARDRGNPLAGQPPRRPQRRHQGPAVRQHRRRRLARARPRRPARPSHRRAPARRPPPLRRARHNHRATTTPSPATCSATCSSRREAPAATPATVVASASPTSTSAD